MPIFETERLTLRNFMPGDWPALHEIIVLYQASDVAPYDQPWPTSPEEIRKVTQWFASGDAYLAVCLKETGQLIGFVGLNPEKSPHEFNIGYVFHPQFHGKGYATEACRAVLNHAFGQLQASQVITGTAAANRASCRLLERLGFQKCGEEMVSFKIGDDGKPIEFLGCRYAISNRQWKAE